jgi:membrane associated rhomboid family serine protease
MTTHPVVASEKKVISDIPIPENFDPPPGWGAAAVFDSTRAAHEAGLAILAMGHAYWLLPHGETYIICVATATLPAVRRELEAMQRLGTDLPPRHRELPYEEVGVRPGSFVLYGLLLSLFFGGQNYLPIKTAGRMDAVRMVDDGEWWRAITALTLHGDIVHLVSNIVAGIGFAFLLARFFGAGAAWLLIVMTGAAGNALNAWVHHPDAHFSIGASTAVFGALGLITGVGLWVALMQPAERWTMPRWLLPAFGGLTLLGLLGIGDGLDARIDVAAHISGFLCGAAAGFVCAIRQGFFVRLDRRGKWLGLLALVLIGAAWLPALFI